MAEPLVYQAADGRWLVFNNEIKSDYFNTEAEAVSMASKLGWSTQMQAAVTSFAQVIDQLTDLRTVYTDRGYQAAGADPIIDADIESLGFTAANLTSLSVLIDELNNFLSQGVVTNTQDYDKTLNLIRTFGSST